MRERQVERSFHLIQSGASNLAPPTFEVSVAGIKRHGLLTLLPFRPDFSDSDTGNYTHCTSGYIINYFVF